MADKDYILAIDSGTQSIRAVLFDREGNELAIEQARYSPYASPQPGWAEQSTDEYWANLCTVTKGLMARITIDPKNIAGVGITTQRGTVIPMDREGNALRPAIIWLDRRTVTDPPPMGMAVKLLFGAAGLLNAVRYAQKHSFFLWIKQNEPEVYRKTYKFAQASGFFVRKLTGEFRDSSGMVTGIWPFDYKNLRWHSLGLAYGPLGMMKEHCVELFPPDKVLGRVTKQASLETGLPEGLPVVVGAGDKQSELLGAGALDPKIAEISFGTATAMHVMTRKYLVDKGMRFFCWPAAIPDTWDIEMFIFRGFWMVSWFKEEFGHREALLAQERGCAPEVIFDETIRDIPPGCMGLMLQPYWSPMVYNKYAKGSMIGFADIHTRAHIYRAILEGIGFELKRLAEVVQKRIGVRFEEIRVGGGGSKSDVAVQIAADMFNLPVSRMATSEICALGAAIDTAVATGVHPGFDAAVKAMVRKGRTFHPNPSSTRIYNDLFNEVYMKSYTAIEPLNRKIAQITGYPPEE
ncbi:MAG TPA: FGGY-family carbohydrate kinase [Deltaproteobacteria bacterium]|jgi:sugar (pentulose or hexulose) kinase|nr:FGGY-family carbohydrate kinase [Deltaproteobacteria bacterium]HOI08214.1 FGGY-family carbohydrate kinase [Deltaproteobacteria bacterium]